MLAPESISADEQIVSFQAASLHYIVFAHGRGCDETARK
jgi:hypothetical protein